MTSFVWSGEEKELLQFWGDDFSELYKLIKNTDGPVVNEAWMDKELYAIGKCGIAQEFIDLHRSGKKYTNPSNSSVAYFLGVTDIAPDDYPKDMVYRVARVSPPDVDIDTDDRDWMIDYAKRKYGEDRVAQISTFAKVKPRSGIKDAARILGFDYSTGDKLSKMVPDAILGVEKTMDEVLQTPDLQKEYNSNAESKKILDVAKGLEGTQRSDGLHAAGVIIAQSDITDFIPVRIAGSKNPVLATQIDMHWCERLGMLKADFLGLRNLSVIADTLKRVEERLGEKIDRDEIPLDDQKTFRMLRQGDAIGVFQVEGEGMRSIMVELGVDSIYDIMALIALYRPGPLGSGMHKMYINRKRGREKVTYPHPSLEDKLEKSLGIMLYQEDVLNVITTLAGWSMGEADELRRVIGKKLMSEVANYRDKFVEDCISHSNLPEDRANKIFDDIEYFAGYGFNSAHSASYAMVSYITAYLKANYPYDYMASLLTSVTDNPSKMATYLDECERMGIKVLPPSLSKSRAEFSVEEDGVIRFGFTGIKGIGDSFVTALPEGRDGYSSFQDLLRSVDTSILDTGTFMHLIKAGALDEIGPENPPPIPISRRRDILTMEKDSIGVYITDHPLKDVQHLLRGENNVDIGDLGSLHERAKVDITGIITSLQKRTVKRTSASMYIMEVEDLTGAVEVLIFPKVFPQYEDKISVGDIISINGFHEKESIEGDDGEVISVRSKVFLTSLEHVEMSSTEESPVHIHLESQPDNELVQRMHEVISSHPGNSNVYIHFIDNGAEYTFLFNKKMNALKKEELEKVRDKQ